MCHQMLCREAAAAEQQVQRPAADTNEASITRLLCPTCDNCSSVAQCHVKHVMHHQWMQRLHARKQSSDLALRHGGGVKGLDCGARLFITSITYFAQNDQCAEAMPTQPLQTPGGRR